MRRFLLIAILIYLPTSTSNGEEIVLQNGLNDYNGSFDSWASKKQVYFAGSEKLIENYWTTPEDAADDSVLIQKFEYSHT